jgi:hypothetical protein
VGDDLVAKNLREKCVNDKVRKVIGNVDNLDKMWGTMDTTGGQKSP